MRYFGDSDPGPLPALCVILVCVFLFLHLCGCAGVSSAASPLPSADIPRPWLPLLESCRVADGEACCPATDISSALSGCASIRGDALRCRERLLECSATGEIDKQVAESELRNAQARASTLSKQRWYFGAGGAAVGVVGTLILILLVR